MKQKLRTRIGEALYEFPQKVVKNHNWWDEYYKVTAESYYQMGQYTGRYNPGKHRQWTVTSGYISAGVNRSKVFNVYITSIPANAYSADVTVWVIDNHGDKNNETWSIWSSWR